MLRTTAPPGAATLGRSGSRRQKRCTNGGALTLAGARRRRACTTVLCSSTRRCAARESGRLTACASRRSTRCTCERGRTWRATRLSPARCMMRGVRGPRTTTPTFARDGESGRRARAEVTEMSFDRETCVSAAPEPASVRLAVSQPRVAVGAPRWGGCFRARGPRPGLSRGTQPKIPHASHSLHSVSDDAHERIVCTSAGSGQSVAAAAAAAANRSRSTSHVLSDPCRSPGRQARRITFCSCPATRNT
mmetsp:Transcript_38580/g.125161  ORF Transcript_38580/g.125161 Transcript_38580/m.125161 type:complete len:248 (-) Transcript_38580:1221-1964(-)